MNQGNVEKWKGDNGIWQDGGILIHFEKGRKMDRYIPCLPVTVMVYR
ncbi:DUF2278 family protein [Bacillus paranthracis]